MSFRFDLGHRINNNHVLSFSMAIDGNQGVSSDKLKIHMAYLWIMVTPQSNHQVHHPTHQSRRSRTHNVNKRQNVNSNNNEHHDANAKRRRRRKNESFKSNRNHINNNNFYYDNHKFNNHITNNNNNNDNHIIKSSRNTRDEQPYLQRDSVMSASREMMMNSTNNYNKINNQNSYNNLKQHNITLWIFRVRDANHNTTQNSHHNDTVDEDISEKVTKLIF
jgi:sensor c-di-GMP phosphodiesterase-like protein